MATRKRRPFASQSSDSRQESRQRLRRSLVETLEQRQLLAAGPQLIGIQPNDGALIEDGVTRNIAPRVLTFRFDQGQQIHPGTLDAIQITRAGNDGVFDTGDDVAVEPGTISVGSPAGNEVLVRFADALPDDRYRIEVFGYDDANQGIVGLRNTAADGSPGLLLQPRDAASRKESIEFDLRLGALVEAVVPQPVVRLSDGSLQQRRDQIVVYFNEDELFVEHDASGNPTARSADNPRFYQLLHTQESVRTTDDYFVLPESVEYDATTHTATLTFADDIDKLALDASGTTLQAGGGTFRLRIGTAIDDRAELIIQPNRINPSGAEPGDTFGSAYDVGLLGDGSTLSNLVISGRIEAGSQQYLVELPGGNSDPGHRELDESVGNSFEQHVNSLFGADVTAGVTTISYNFQQFYTTSSNGVPLVNAITGRMQQRVREALSLWSNYLGVQFTETTDQGVTFAVGNPNEVTGDGTVRLPSLATAVRVDPTFADSLMVLSSQQQWADAYGENFFRTVMTGVGTLLGLEYTGDLPISTLMALSTSFINGPINQNLNADFTQPNSRPLEPIFPGAYDILHGQHLHRADSVDIDMYRFTVDLGDDTTVGDLTAETFAERLSDSSLLDTDLRLFREVKAAIETNLNASETLTVRFQATAEGRLGNRTRIDFIRTDRSGSDNAVKVVESGVNGIRIDLPRGQAVTAQQLVDAVNSLSTPIVTAEIVFGDGATNINVGDLSYTPLLLSGGGTEELARNDDYFSEDSLLRASLTSGTYYIGVAASGNAQYDPTISGTGFGGRTEGAYELQLKFEPQVDKVNVLRDRDAPRAGLPGTPIDGDGDGVPGGEFNFWFQARPEHRQLHFNASGNVLSHGQAITITGATGAVRTYQFTQVGSGGTTIAGATPVSYLASDTPAALALKLRTAVNAQSASTGVQLSSDPSNPATLSFTGERSIDVSSNFRGAEIYGRTIFVDKTAGPNADGSAARPFNNISNPSVPNAFDAAMPGDIVRIVGNGGQDQKLETQLDNFAYKIGFAESSGILEDGSTMEVPGGVTVMVDAGAVFKLRSSRIGVGSSTLLVDRSGGALQVLGTPRLVDAAGDLVMRNGEAISGDVVFTSSRDKTIAQPTPENSQAPAAGNWGGLVYRRDLDQAEGRADLEDQGIFLQYVNHADIRYGGGGNILIDAVQQIVNPIQIVDMRPTVTFNRITKSADAAMSAAPNSFEETSYAAPRFQQAGAFTADYDRVGPDIHHNQLVDNSLNALFIRIETRPGAAPRQLTVPGRFDDIDIVHALSENLVLAGTPGGPIADGVAPTVDLITTAVSSGGGTLAAGTYDYRMTFVDADGFESLPSDASASVTVANNNGAVMIEGLPPTPENYVFRRLYRLDPATSEYRLVADLNSTDTGFFDSGSTTEGKLDLTRNGVRGRSDASLIIDPGAVLKLEGARIELGIGTQLLAEGVAGQEVVFTSKLDDRYGTGGTFDTNNDVGTVTGNNAPQPGDWGGIYAAPGAHVSLDHSVIAFGGGLTRIEGTVKAFNPLELHQATARVTNSSFESNANGQGGQGPTGRFGRLANTPATVFVRGADPILVGNTFIDNGGSVIDIDANSLDGDYMTDKGRQSGSLGRLVGLDDNRGPLVRRNLLENNGLNGMEIRGATLTTESMWDDTDIVHVLYDTITVGNFHSSGGLRLRSRPDESLVVKLVGDSSPYHRDWGTGITATGTQGDVSDRIGGTVQIIGQPGYPVIMTSLYDDTVGAGRRPDGSQQTDTNNDRYRTRPTAGDWRSVLLDQWSNDRNVATVLELESPNQVAPGPNGTALTAQVLGDLAGSIYQSDENLRLGFAIEGHLSEPTDVDTYAFTGIAGTDVWIDIDRTTFSLDTVLELLDASGNVLATSDNSFAEVASPNGIGVQSSLVDGRVGPLANGPAQFHDIGSGGLYRDFESTNPRDAGMRVALPGVSGTRSVYHFRIRSGSVNPTDAAGGVTSGGYRAQVRIQEEQEFAGSSVLYADIRYANHGVHLRGLPGTSPLIGEFQENEGQDQTASNNGSITSDPSAPGRRAQYVGNLLETSRNTISIGGALAHQSDIDFYEMVVDHNNIRSSTGLLHQSAVFDVDYADGLSRPDTNIAVYYDPDGPTRPAQPQLVLFGRDSNIAEDRPSPLTSLASEILARGSYESGDPFLGPVALPEGYYYVGISNGSAVPNQIANNPQVRLEPINSVTRIIDDTVESQPSYVATPPVVPQMFSRDSLPPGWSVTNERATDAGHGASRVFDGSRGGVDLGNFTRQESEPNNNRNASDSLDTSPQWTMFYDGNIGDTFSNTSLTIPHTTVNGLLTDAADVYELNVPVGGERLIVDIDGTSGLNTKLFLLEADGTIVAQSSISSTFSGAGGSATINDPFLDVVVANPGDYYIAVVQESADYDDAQFAGGTPFTFDDDAVIQAGQYTLHVSLEGHPAFGGGSPSNQSLKFNGSSGSGSLLSNGFSLAGYSAEDKPYAYFNYLIEDSADSVRVTAVSDQNPSGTVIASTGNSGVNLIRNGRFYQARIALDAFAGHTGIQLRFDYTPGTGGGGDLFLDDFIVGFAERGEIVTNATPGDDSYTIGTAGAISSGEYQVEIREGTEYFQTGTNGVLDLVSSFDTNDRHTEAVTLLAPSGRELSDGNFFTLSDGAKSVTFEFDRAGSASGVTLGRIRIPFAATDTAAQVATAIRNAINHPSVQGSLKIDAAGADGNDTTALSDNRIDLVGAVTGDFAEISVSNLQIDATPLSNADVAGELLGGGLSLVGTPVIDPVGQVGRFSGGQSNLGLSDGIVVTNGQLDTLEGPNRSGRTSGTASGMADPQLASVDSSATEFDFQLAGTTAQHLYLEAVFASEEYRGDTPAGFDEVAVYLIANPDSPTPTVSQLAVLPGGTAVNSQTINSSTRSHLYVDNDLSRGGDLLRQIGMDGFTVPLTFSTENLAGGGSPLLPGETYRLRIVVGDSTADEFDSALFIRSGSVATAPPAETTGGGGESLRLSLPAIIHQGFGDSNLARAQSMVIIENTRISDARVYGIWSESGDRMIDPEDQRSLPGSSILDNPWVNPIPMFSNSPGAVRNLPAANDSVEGGLAAGPVIRNNVIDQAGYVGIHIEGEMQPFTIDSNSIVDAAIIEDDYDIDGSPAFGSLIADGVTFAIDAAGTRVVFEFEDIGGDPTNELGSGQVGGDGFTDGHVPVYYRKGGGALYNPNGPTPFRNYASSRQEVMNAIYDAILGSILVTNDLIPLVEVHQGPSYFRRDLAREQSYSQEQDFPTSAIFIQGATHIDFTGVFAKGGSSGPFFTRQIPVADAPQPFARIVNNTIYGADGTASLYPGQGTDESNDTLETAVDTRQGRSHDENGYVTIANIGDSGASDPTTDVDLYRFELTVGDRVQIDIDTLPDGPDTTLRLFNSRGAVQAFLQNGQWVTASHAALSDDDVPPVAGGPSNQDPYIDFTATETDTYFVSVSSAGNESFDPLSLAQRTSGVGGTGEYELAMRVLAPRQFVFSLDPTGTSLIGTTFTIEQIADLPGQTANEVVFEFTGGGAPTTPGAVPIPIRDYGPGGSFVVPDIMRAIAGAINGPGTSPLPLPNHELNNGPFGVNGPITRVEATALGGISGYDNGLQVFDGPGLNRYHIFTFGNIEDLQRGFGHDRTAQVGSSGFAGTTTAGDGTSELYVLIKNAANVTISPQAAAAGLGRDPRPGMNTDQLLPEIGVLASQGASPTLLNNIIINTQAAVVNEETRIDGFGDPNSRGIVDLHPKKGEVIVVGSVFQYTETENMLFRQRIIFERGRDAGITTDAAVGPSNVNGGSDDFNFDVGNGTTLLVNPAGNQFYPAAGSIVIDSSVDSLAERNDFASLKQSIGLAVSPLLSPNRDLTGQLRADDPQVSTPSGLGSNIFKDRGAFDRADFVGPIAILDAPLDNDSSNLDLDPAVSFVQLAGGIYNEFRILLRDAGDASDPFLGTGIDDSSVLVPQTAANDRVGGVLTLFEDGKLLIEGVDYTFSYDETKNLITLRPLAGIWRSESVYEIALNNRDRFIATAPESQQVSDGEQFTVVDSDGGRVTFEFEAGYQIEVPEVISLAAPAALTGAGGIADGDRVVIHDGFRQRTFEYTTEAGNIVPGNLPVLFSLGDSAEQLLDSLEAAIQAKIDDGTFSTTIENVGSVSTVSLLRDPVSGDLRIGMEAGGLVDASGSGLLQSARTLALRVPTLGAAPGGIADGDTFVIDDGWQTVTFEFDTNGSVASGRQPVSISGRTDPAEVVQALATALDATELRVRASKVSDELLYLGLPESGTATVTRGQLAAVSYARTLDDAGTITLTAADGTPWTFELNRADEAGGDDGVATGNTPIAFSRTDSADEIAARIAAAIRTATPLGLNPTAPGSGLISLGADATGELTLAGADELSIISTPGVTPSSTIGVRGPLYLRTPVNGGSGIGDNTTFTVADSTGATELFMFNLENTPAPANGATRITYNFFDSPSVLASKIATAINGSTLGVVAAPLPTGEVSLGDIPVTAVDLTGTSLTTRRGIVGDGETVRITHGGQTFVFEFEEANAGGGVQAGATPVLFPANGTTDQIAEALADAIRVRAGSFGLNATHVGEGQVRLTDSPQTQIDLTAASTLSLSGAPGGAVPVHFVPTPSFTAEDMKLALIEAINSVNSRGGGFVSSLTAGDRGGDTLFLENAVSVNAAMENFFLPAIRDLEGNPLKANREDGSTQFTLLLPTVGLDFGDAPDPVTTIPGRYPTRFDHDGARHVVTPNGPRLGSLVDADPNGRPGPVADGDDVAIEVVGSYDSLFTVSRETLPGSDALDLVIRVGASFPTDGGTITISTGLDQATLELDSDGIFDEDNYAIEIAPGDSPAQIAEAVRQAILASPLRPADVVVDGATVRIVSDDEDGVRFDSAINPFGVFNPNITTEVTVTVTGVGFVDGWVDFNGDGDWSDPGEQIFKDVFFDGSEPTQTFAVTVPASTPVPNGPLDTFARFRVSSTGGLSPSGLAIDGEVEDYAVRVVPGRPPVPNNPNLEYHVNEDLTLVGLDADGTTTPSMVDDGLLAGITDPDGDVIEVYATPSDPASDEYILGVGTFPVTTNGERDGTIGGYITINPDGRFTFNPLPDFFGDLVFKFRVTDAKPAGEQDQELVNADPVTVTISVDAVNDAPTVVGPLTLQINDLAEDQPIVLTAADLIEGRFSPGPANESDQELRILSAGYGGTANVTRRGGSLEITSSGQLIYTPPANYTGPEPDEFVYRVVDVPGGALTPREAAQPGTVVISFVPANDPPSAGADTYSGVEDNPVTIPLRGGNGILTNDAPGPQDEVAEGQTISLVPGQFPRTTLRGGTVTLSGDGNSLIYTPRANFAGTDSFEYQIVDSDGSNPRTAVGTVSINVSAVNDAAIYAGPNALSYIESKDTAKTYTIDLNTWFTDPEGDALSFSVISGNGSLVQSSVSGGTLTLTLPPFQNGNTNLTITATNPGGSLPTQVTIPVTVTNTPDAPRVIGTLDPLMVNEDAVISEDLSTIFSDPDGGPLGYSVVTPAGQVDPFDRSLVEEITFVNGRMNIVLVPNASGSTEITIRATDGQYQVFETFTLSVAPQADVPTGGADHYTVPVRGRLAIIDPRNGLLANDSEADGDAFTVDVASVSDPLHGTVDVNADGTFSYTNLRNESAGETDTFSYRLIDKDGRSVPVQVTITMTRSTHQNPVDRLDTNADGSVSPIDALRVINLLNRQNGSPAVRDLPAPPDYYDVNGDGLVTPLDALVVINHLNRNPAASEGESLQAEGGLQAEGESSVDLRTGTSTAWVAAGTWNLPQSGFVASTADEDRRPSDELAGELQSSGANASPSGDLFAELSVIDGRLAGAVDALLASDGSSSGHDPESTDAALSDLWSELDSDLLSN
ncbi:tandem-95 repeat protein [Candidatus Laterigemmans baculatus]|uniref:tandem-95 repeat protein n=1 Tax=Candidatus Laterigemmans baculatus TaxID=2770505 RepID=UPI0013DA8B48|nr:Ig-like domain-containing protein [Candidatus Laterigemmans baculatus]